MCPNASLGSLLLICQAAIKCGHMPARKQFVSTADKVFQVTDKICYIAVPAIAQLTFFKVCELDLE